MAIETANYVTYADAARRMGVTRSAVWKLVRLGRLATVEVDGRRYVPLAAVRERQAKRPRSWERTWRREKGTVR